MADKVPLLRRIERMRQNLRNVEYVSTQIARDQLSDAEQQHARALQLEQSVQDSLRMTLGESATLSASDLQSFDDDRTFASASKLSAVKQQRAAQRRFDAARDKLVSAERELKKSKNIHDLHIEEREERISVHEQKSLDEFSVRKTIDAQKEAQREAQHRASQGPGEA